MQDPHAPAEHGTATAPFSDTELRALHSEDVNGGKAIVLLMASIFVIGLVLYIFVAWWVSS
jgi:hypothetical protein